MKAIREKKMVGSLAWLFHVQSTGALVSPIDQLLHFPIPKSPVEGFDQQACIFIMLTLQYINPYD